MKKAAAFALVVILTMFFATVLVVTRAKDEEKPKQTKKLDQRRDIPVPQPSSLRT